MSALFSLFVLLLALMDPPPGLSAEQHKLKGRVLHPGDSGMSMPVPGAEVRIAHVGNPYTTNDKGEYRVVVPSAYVFGQSIQLYVDKSGWAIAKPEDGKFELPSDLTKDLLLKREDDEEFLSNAHIDGLIERLAQAMTSQVRPDGRAQEIDPTQAVADYAVKHHFEYPRVRARVEERIAHYQRQEDLRLRCLAAIYRKDQIRRPICARRRERQKERPT
jgi:hypothetical protein